MLLGMWNCICICNWNFITISVYKCNCVNNNSNNNIIYICKIFAEIYDRIFFILLVVVVVIAIPLDIFTLFSIIENQQRRMQMLLWRNAPQQSQKNSGIYKMYRGFSYIPSLSSTSSASAQTWYFFAFCFLLLSLHSLLWSFNFVSSSNAVQMTVASFHAVGQPFPWLWDMHAVFCFLAKGQSSYNFLLPQRFSTVMDKSIRIVINTKSVLNKFRLGKFNA